MTVPTAALDAASKIDSGTTTLVGLVDQYHTDALDEGARADAAVGALIDATAENKALQAQLDALLHPPVPTPTRPDTHLGATVNARNGQSIAAAVASWESTHGALDVVRCFNGNLPTTIQASGAAAHVGLRHIILSVKPGSTEPTAAYWDGVINSYPKGTGKMLLLSVNHEAENDAVPMTPTVLRRRLDLMESRITLANRPDILSACIYMGYLEDDNVAATSTSDWFPTNCSRFVMLFDPYDPLNKRTMQSKAEATIALWKLHGGVWFGIAETGSHRTGADLANWITTGLRWLHSVGALFVCWFHSAQGADGPWWLDDDAGSAAWKALAPVISG